jgi:hypothetical protein
MSDISGRLQASADFRTITFEGQEGAFFPYKEGPRLIRLYAGDAGSAPLNEAQKQESERSPETEPPQYLADQKDRAGLRDRIGRWRVRLRLALWGASIALSRKLAPY